MTVDVRGFGKITATKDALNAISLMLFEASKSYAARERTANAQDALHASTDLYMALLDAGYDFNYGKER